MQKVAFIIPPTVWIYLGPAGPVQVFTEAKFYGSSKDIEFYHFRDKPVSTAGFRVEKIKNYGWKPKLNGRGIFVSCFQYCILITLAVLLFKALKKEFFKWAQRLFWDRGNGVFHL